MHLQIFGPWVQQYRVALFSLVKGMKGISTSNKIRTGILLVLYFMGFQFLITNDIEDLNAHF